MLPSFETLKKRQGGQSWLISDGRGEKCKISFVQCKSFSWVNSGDRGRHAWIFVLIIKYSRELAFIHSTSKDSLLIKSCSLRFWYPISNGGGPTENREQQREPHSDRETERLYRGHWIGAGEVTIQLLGHLVPWSMSGCSQCSLLAVTITRYTLAYCITQNILVQEVFRTPWW